MEGMNIIERARSRRTLPRYRDARECTACPASKPTRAEYSRVVLPGLRSFWIASLDHTLFITFWLRPSSGLTGSLFHHCQVPSLSAPTDGDASVEHSLGWYSTRRAPGDSRCSTPIPRFTRGAGATQHLVRDVVYRQLPARQGAAPSRLRVQRGPKCPSTPTLANLRAQESKARRHRRRRRASRASLDGRTRLRSCQVMIRYA
jgi:hypothetical protein